MSFRLFPTARRTFLSVLRSRASRRFGGRSLHLPETEKLDSCGATGFRQGLLHAIQMALKIFIAGPARVRLGNSCI
jgi:hypothetical protein